MKRFLESIYGWLLAVAVVLVLLLSWGVDHYRAKASTAVRELQQLQAEVGEQNRTAQKTLDRLKAERDAAQAKLDKQHQEQEKTDANTIAEIARLTGELEQRPVRVRVVTQATACRGGSGSAEGHTAAAADPGAADAAQAYGLLPESNSRRLGAVIAEAETINAAYASCRATLINNNH